MPQEKDNRLAEKEEVKNFIADQEIEKLKKESGKHKTREGKKILIIISIIALLVISGLFLIFSHLKKNSSFSTSPDSNSNLEVNINNSLDNINNQEQDSSLEENTNSKQPGNLDLNKELKTTGRVFIKAYGTPSESYGIITTDGNEIGLGNYDSMREQFRPYVNDNIIVTFKNVCRSNTSGCCRTVFFYCGIVKEWKPSE